MGKLFATWLALASLATPALSQAEGILVEGHNGRLTELSSVVERIEPGTILIVSEYHDQASHHVNQLSVLTEIRDRFSQLSVGMEFFYWPDQPVLDTYLQGRISEAEFLTAIKWGGDNYEFYRPLVLYPLLHGGWTVALNAPRALTGKIAQSGLASLSDAERALLPANFTLGNAAYKDRFREVMGGGHIPAEKFENYFAAQSAWDETMADRACRFQANRPSGVLVVIVGDFHATYGGGLPDRIRQRCRNPVTVISQMTLESLPADPAKVALEPEVAPHPNWGVRADYIWITKHIGRPSGARRQTIPKLY